MFCWRLWVLESVCCLWDRVWGSHLSHPIVCFCCCCLSKSEGLDIELTTLKPSRGSVCRSLYLPDFLCVLIHLCLSLPPFLLVFLCVLIQLCLSLPPFLFTPLSSLLFEFSHMCRKRSLYSTTNVIFIFESTHPKRLHSAVVYVYVCLMLEQCAHNYL